MITQICKLISLLILITFLSIPESEERSKDKSEVLDVISLLADLRKPYDNLKNVTMSENEIYFSARQNFLNLAHNFNANLFDLNVTESCSVQLEQFLEGLVKRKLWTIQGSSYFKG